MSLTQEEAKWKSRQPTGHQDHSAEENQSISTAYKISYVLIFLIKTLWHIYQWIYILWTD